MSGRRTTLVAAGVALLAVAVAVTAIAIAATRGGSSNGPYGYTSRMMGSGYAYQPSKSTPVTSLAGARADAQRFADRLGLRVAEVLRFRENFYAKLVDNQGRGATEVLVDPRTGLVSIEYGPAMMWNTRYGVGRGAEWMTGSYGASMMRGYGAGAMMGGAGGGYGAADDSGYGGMMGGSGSGPGNGYGSGSGYGPGYGTGPDASGSGATPATTVNLAQAHTLAQRWLDAHQPGLEVERGGDTFPGYYTLETLRGGRISGMVSVNATTGAVWPHWWHGAFIAKWEA